MILTELLSLPIEGKRICIVGMCAGGKTWLAKQFDPHERFTIHTDDYLGFSEVATIHSIEEESYLGIGKPFNIVEGCFAYQLLLAGQQRETYIPDIVINVIIPAGKQRQIYLKERDATKIKHLKRFHEMNLALFNEWYKKAKPETEVIHFNNLY